MKNFRVVVSVITLHFSFDVSLTTLDLILSYNKSGISHLRHFRIENLSYNPPSHQAWGSPPPLVAIFFLATRLSIDETLDVAQPAGVLALLLDVDVVGDEDGEGLCDATLLEEALHEDLEVVVEAAEGGSGVDVGALLGGLGALDLGDLGVGVVEEVLDDNVAVLGGGIDVEGADGLAGFLDDDGQVDGGSVLLLEIVLELLVNLLLGGAALLLAVAALDGIVLEALLLKSAVLSVGIVVGDVGNGEADGDPAIGVSQGSRRQSGPQHVLLVAKVTLQLDDLLAGGVNQLEGAVVEEVLDAGGLLLAGLHVFLDLELALELGRKLLVGLAIGSPSEDGGGEGGAGRSQGAEGRGLDESAGAGNGRLAEGETGHGAGRRSREGADGEHCECGEKREDSGGFGVGYMIFVQVDDGCKASRATLKFLDGDSKTDGR